MANGQPPPGAGLVGTAGTPGAVEVTPEDQNAGPTENGGTQGEMEMDIQETNQQV